MGGFGAIYPILSLNCIYVGEYAYHIIPKIKQNFEFVPFFYNHLPICNPDSSNTPRKSRCSGDGRDCRPHSPQPGTVHNGDGRVCCYTWISAWRTRTVGPGGKPSIESTINGATRGREGGREGRRGRRGGRKEGRKVGRFLRIVKISGAVPAGSARV